MHSLILRAADFAAHKHRGQRRKGSREFPYINHPLTVARLLADVGGVDDAEIIAAALLHDTLEDTETHPQELAREFGQRVLELVVEVSDDKALDWHQRKRAQIARAPGLSSGAVVIKLADKTSNIRDIIDSPPQGWSVERRLRYLDWAEAVIDGCRPVNAPLEALFRATLAEGRRVLGRGVPLGGDGTRGEGAGRGAGLESDA